MLAAGVPAVAAGAVVLALLPGPGQAQGNGQPSCTQKPPVDGSVKVQVGQGVSVIRPPAEVPAGTQLIVGARYTSVSRFKSVYAFIMSAPGKQAIGEQFFAGAGGKWRCAPLGGKLQANTTRYIVYQLVPKQQGGKRTKITYRVTTANEDDPS